MGKKVLNAVPILWESTKYFSLLFVVLSFFYSCTGDGSGGKDNTGNTDPEYKGEITFYTNRYTTMEQHLVNTFTERKFIKVNVVTDSPEGLLAKLSSEGDKTTADVILLDNLVDMYAAKAAGVLQPFSTDSVAHAMPSRNTDHEGYWAGFTKYPIGYGCNKLAIPKPSVINVYEDITNRYWKGRVVVSNASNKENQFLVATMIAEKGEAATRAWLQKLVDNFAIDPVADSEAVIRAVAERKGEISFINASEHIRWTNSGSTDNFETGSKVGVKVPKDDNNKSYYNLVSLGLSRFSDNRNDALKFIDYMISYSAQKYYCDLTFEFPVNVFTIPSDFILSVGGYAEKELDFLTASQNIERAKTLMQEAGWK
ncbi:MAG: extracellular solute-binding protein [Bacteroidetes bacterium]|nr:MAG: extracellular solute-binding protein [Bacteroidota bacterium]